VKSKVDILKRLKKLRIRYAKNHIKCSQERKHKNCVYNHEQTPLSCSNSITEVELAPREISTVILIRDNDSTFYCSYGSDDPEHWSGLICDRDEIAEKCKWFIPKVNAKEARIDFLQLIEDDKYVYENYPDLAALQWALGDRVYKHALSWWDRLVFWLWSRVFKPKSPAALPPAEDIPEDLWNDSPKNSGTRSP